MRKQLIEELSTKKHFYLKNELIDKKIEFDQRFFNDGYQQFQLMVSDVRAQFKINEEVLIMRKLIQSKK